MSLFARYYENRKLIEVSMSEIENLIQSESNKEIISKYIFHRYYDRYLKIFYFKSDYKAKYKKIIEGEEISVEKNIFEKEYKNGFSIMTNCCLLIETIATFFEGENTTTKTGPNTFKLVFQKATSYGNPIDCFEKEKFHSQVRCGLLHQGETYGKFKIRRTKQLFDSTTKTINAKLFCDNLRSFLKSYQKELNAAKWDSGLWRNCRAKLEYIIKNSRKN